MRSEADRLALLVPAALELRGGPVAQRRMAPPEVVETLQETEDLATRLLAGSESHALEQLAFHCGEKAFRHGVGKSCRLHPLRIVRAGSFV